MGDFLTRAFVWLALGGYSLSVLFQLVPARPRTARWMWVLGALAFVMHVVCAFHFVHRWSHAAAFAETARQTEELTGFASGSGLYLNYVFTALWVVDAVWWLTVGDAIYVRRARTWTMALHGFFLFMFVNGAIVFANGAVRWYAGGMLAMMLAAALRLRHQRSRERTS